MQTDPKRVRVGPNLYQRTKDGRFEDVRVVEVYDAKEGRKVKKQRSLTLQARTLTEARKEQRAVAVEADKVPPGR